MLTVFLLKESNEGFYHTFIDPSEDTAFVINPEDAEEMIEEYRSLAHVGYQVWNPKTWDFEEPVFFNRQAPKLTETSSLDFGLQTEEPLNEEELNQPW
jgi:hypothetical protein